jgi:hypothetical protein
MTVRHPHWQCLGCGEIIYYVGAANHLRGCKDHPRCEKYQEAKYRASGMWPVNWSRDGSSDPAARLPRGHVSYMAGRDMTLDHLHKPCDRCGYPTRYKLWPTPCRCSKTSELRDTPPRRNLADDLPAGRLTGPPLQVASRHAAGSPHQRPSCVCVGPRIWILARHQLPVSSPRKPPLACNNEIRWRPC